MLLCTESILGSYNVQGTIRMKQSMSCNVQPTKILAEAFSKNISTLDSCAELKAAGRSDAHVTIVPAADSCVSSTEKWTKDTKLRPRNWAKVMRTELESSLARMGRMGESEQCKGKGKAGNNCPAVRSENNIRRSFLRVMTEGNGTKKERSQGAGVL